MLTHNIDPTILTIGPLEIRWYGLMYVLAFLAVFYYAKRAINNGKLRLTEKELDNFLVLLVVAMIAGARIFYAVFYNPTYFLNNPLKIIAVWEGGLSFHGGLAGMLLAAIWYTRKKNLSLLKIADVFVVPLAIGNALGRLGNFINSEIYGVPTDLPWGVVFPGIEGARHPTQLYAVAYNLIIFGILYSQRNKEWKPGRMLGLFMILYSVFRFVNEIFKDMVYYGPLTMGQWLTIPVLLIGIWLVYRQNP